MLCLCIRKAGGRAASIKREEAQHGSALLKERMLRSSLPAGNGPVQARLHPTGAAGSRRLPLRGREEEVRQRDACATRRLRHPTPAALRTDAGETPVLPIGIRSHSPCPPKKKS
jgi:hypothetical protein